MHYKEKLVVLIMRILEKTLHNNLRVAVVLFCKQINLAPH